VNAKEAFFDCLKTEFAPKIRSFGFKGSGLNFYRIRDEVIQVINIQVNKYRGSCCVNLGLHLAFLPIAGGNLLADPNKLRVTSCEFRWRLAPPGATDYWWEYEEGVAAHLPYAMEGGRGTGPIGKAHHLIATYETYGGPRLQSVTTIEAIAHLFRPDDIGSGKPLPMYGYTHPRGALTMARIHKYLGNENLTKQFAKAGLENIGKAKALRMELENLLS
jgi:hypothetical protein